ncbi:Holliday junction resolvase RuvX [Candidatus Falkowbacteria bacterium CG_4_10_14_0_2_um_filter_36_22]|uniref:Putative pre-16S rRNA nuclease n=1 Tax=Candidatus Falkowbacteria bacterium CG02_land_8_20_14_3_00_36_14 TaxID=1974560 RepID=A0A2M7DQ44_9BACT|nr:MAG: Holliday junction resolvase RuvX [Candidatus Falkowbacteria bacterium CG02_land_8_20_14_3_00_36_14]PIX12090.1 MAG: Holliday junction resolvase RuvX [Candidatus Falkowbacteria bacterium CG_4_8_14_3_um_filter_36_11]PJA10864.1 MAG: Holliday junction resolvase RuvX [Candidatus Falkowbacteria bacterium CG_4_10_14_0_2_um_filter_36_22]
MENTKLLIKYLGIDWGKARIGLAVGDNVVKIATPLKVVGSIGGILQVIKEEEINKIILGMPIKMQKSKIKMQNEFINFLRIIKNKVNIPIHLFDERLTSKAADALAGDKKTKAPRDALAAMIILQSYLDKVCTVAESKLPSVDN